MKINEISFKLLCKVIVIIFPVILIVTMMSISDKADDSSLQNSEDVIVSNEVIVEDEEIVIDTVSPNTVIIGAVEYLYDGKLALSIKGSGFKSGDVIYVNSTACDTTFGDDTWLTCVVEEEVYVTESILGINIRRNKSENLVMESNTIEIEVKKE